MDKTVIRDANMDFRPVHLLPKGIQEIHRKYGLWICKFCREKANRCNPADVPLRHFEFYDLSHMYDGRGWFIAADGKTQEVEKGDGILITPEFRHKYGGYPEFYVEDAISFYGPVADFLFHSGIIKNGILKIGKTRRLLPIIEMALDYSEDSQIKANLELQRLLVDLHFENKEAAGSENPVFEQLFEEIKKFPGRYWTIKAMTDFCMLSASQLTRLFKQKTGMTPKNYIDHLRAQLAAEMLASKSRAIKEIAKELGYPDPYHFSRRFKMLTSFSPQNYRQKFLR